MSGRKTHPQVLIELIDKRIKTVLETMGIRNAGSKYSRSTNPKTESSRAFQDVSFITRNDHRGGGHGDLPNSKPMFDLDCEIVPDKDGIRRLGLSDRAFSIVYTHRVDLKGIDGWLKLDRDYFLEHIAFKTNSNKVLLYGFGNHKIKDASGHTLYPNVISISIDRPIPFSSTRSHTSIKTWRFDPWYSRIDIDNATGCGSRRSCSSNASQSNPGVEAEIIDTGNPEKLYAVFRNYLPYPVVVGVAVSY